MKLILSCNRRTRGKIASMAGAAAIVLMMASAASAGTGSLVRSLILPGAGQAHDGHYTRAAALASTAVASWVGLFATQINYNRAVDNFDNQKAAYLALGADIDNGDVVAFSELTSTYEGMVDAWNLSEDRARYRNLFTAALVTTYAINIVDILLSNRDTGVSDDTAMSIQFQPTKDGFSLVKSFNF